MHTIPSFVLRATLLALALSLLTASVRADTRVVVRSFKGPGAQQVRRAVVQELTRHGVEIVSNPKVDRAAKRRRVRPDGPLGRKEVGRELEISAWIEGRVRRRAGKLEATVTVRDGSHDAEVGELVLRRKKPKLLAAAVKQGLWRSLGSSIEGAEAAEPEYQESQVAQAEGSLGPESAQEPLADATLPADDELPPAERGSFDGPRTDGDEPADARGRKVSALEAHLTFNSLNRSLRFNQAFTQSISNYSLGSAPLVAVGARVYPGAFLSDGVTSYIGLDVSAQRAFGLASQSADGISYDTSYGGYAGAVVGRYPLGEHELNALVGYGVQRFEIDDASATESPVPDVDYRHVRAGAGGRFAILPRTKLGVEAAWLVITATGELGSKSWFPRGTGTGLEGTLYADVSLLGGLDARARVSYQRSGFDFDSREGDNRVAGGAVDSYLTAGLGLAYAY